MLTVLLIVLLVLLLCGGGWLPDNVLPTSASDNPGDYRLGDAEQTGEASNARTASVEVTNLPHLVIIQFYTPPFAGPFRVPVFRVAISPVIGVGPEKKMVRVDACSVVATVQDVQAVRDGAVGHLPGDAACRERPAVRPFYAQHAVAAAALFPRPKRTTLFGERADMRPEMGFHGQRVGRPLTFLGTVASRGAGVNPEQRSADFAGAEGLRRLTGHGVPPRKVRCVGRRCATTASL